MNEITVGLCGRYKFTAIRPDGSERPLTGWIDNIITDDGMDFLARRAGFSRQILNAIAVGTGTAAPAFTDTALGAQIAQTSTSAGTNNGSLVDEDPAYRQRTWTRRFAAGTATGNISEVGVLTETVAYPGDETPVAKLFSRALVLDGEGEPTTIAVLETEALDVTYQLRMYLNKNDQTTTFMIGGTTYDVTYRPGQISVGPDMSVSMASGSSHNCSLYSTSTLGTVYATPGSGGDVVSLAFTEYAQGAFYQDVSATFGLDAASWETGIGAAYVQTALALVQMSFDPKIPKGATKNFLFNLRVAWSRYTLP